LRKDGRGRGGREDAEVKKLRFADSALQTVSQTTLHFNSAANEKIKSQRYRYKLGFGNP